MKQIDKTLKILWLSDIHFVREYNLEIDSLRIYIDSFIEYISNQEKIKKVDYILISGDIANNGDLKEYELFNTFFLDPLEKRLNNAKLLIVPGNHDISRGSAKDYIDNFVQKLSGPQRMDKTDFLNDLVNRPKFYKAFENYTNSFINKKIPKEDSSLEKNRLLYGYVVDKENKVLFILLNSAWYSIGQEFLKKYLDENIFSKKNQIFDELEIEELVSNIKNIAEEYGNQLIGLEGLENTKEIYKKINEYEDFTVITIMHHPTNWLDWKERIRGENSEAKFHFIKENTDLLLTGHEHVPIQHKNEDIKKANNENIIHIAAGCFLNAPPKNNINNFKIYKNWFSTLEYNVKKKTLKQFKHEYKEGKWSVFNNEKELNNNQPIIELNKKYNRPISSKRADAIVSYLQSSRIELFKLMGKDIDITVSKNPVKNYYLVKENNVYNLYILVKKDLRKKIKQKVETLKKYIDNQKQEINVICFVFFDFYHHESKEYFSRDRLKVLNEITDDFDFGFDTFRYKFFTSNEVKKEINRYSHLKFISKVYPYWEIEHNIIKN
ncbi:MAG: metallophosphoesterase [Bacteroidota bacterium]